MSPAPGAVLVVGGTAILRPAVVELLAAGRAVTVVSRSADRLAQLPTGASGVLGDLDDPVGLAAVLAGLPEPPAAALAYLPGPRSAALAVLRRAVVGPVVAVLTSAVTTPAADSTDADEDWQDAASGRPDGRPDGRPGERGLVRVAAELDASTSAGRTTGVLRVLVLGWVPRAGGRPARWHTPEEISAAALAGMDDPRPRRLGVLRPWDQRPGP